MGQFNEVDGKFSFFIANLANQEKINSIIKKSSILNGIPPMFILGDKATAKINKTIHTLILSKVRTKINAPKDKSKLINKGSFKISTMFNLLWFNYFTNFLYISAIINGQNQNMF